MLGRPGRRTFLPPVEEVEGGPPSRPYTPVYPRSFAQEEISQADLGEGAKLGSQVSRKLADGRYHDAGDLARDLGGLDRLATAFADLVRRGYAIDRGGDHVRMRRRGDGEPETIVVAVLEGIVVREVSEDVEAVDEGVPGEGEILPSTEGEVGTGEVWRVGDEEVRGLVLSDPSDENQLVVSYDYVPGMSNTILARKGSGKTYLAGVIVEELVAMPEGPEVVVVDPLGGWWGLGAKADGSPSDVPFLVLGGSRGHLPLRAGDGTRVAALVAVVRPCPVVLDLSVMPPSEQYLFVADFGDAMWAGERFPVHVVVDEADEFCPQRFGTLSAEQRRSRDAVERLVMRGRSAGYGVTLVSLRPAVLSMNARSQTGCMWLLCLAAPQDVAAVAGWMEAASQGLSEDRLSTCLGQLPVLPRGTAFMVRGGDEPALRKFKVRKKRTFDSSRTDAATMSLEARLASPGDEVLSKAKMILNG